MTKRNKNILLTFDYELFFGPKTGTIDNCMIKPTYQLLNLFKTYDIKGTFFVDILFLIKLKESNLFKDDYEKIIKQIHDIILSGSRIELHIHSHWLNSDFSKSEFKIIHYDNYRIQNLDPVIIPNLIEICYNELISICKEADPNYKIVAYRAGGFCIQPFLNEIANTFKEKGIYIDSSIAYGCKSKSQIHYFDFTNACNKNYYNFSNNPLNESIDGTFTEVPITTFRRIGIVKILYKIYKIISQKKFISFGDGTGIYFPIPFINKITTTHEMLSLDATISKSEFNYLLNFSNKIFFNVIGHPKSLSKYSFEILDFIARQHHNFKTFIDFENEH